MLMLVQPPYLTYRRPSSRTHQGLFTFKLPQGAEVIECNEVRRNYQDSLLVADTKPAMFL